MPDRPPPQDVLLALLALDSYSRGDHAQILDKDGNHTTIGAASWIRVSDTLLPEAPSVGFCASQYTLSDETTVIAYRGTDFDFSSSTLIEGLKQDVYGWLSSFGVLGEPQRSSALLRPLVHKAGDRLRCPRQGAIATKPRCDAAYTKNLRLERSE
jgi:hypothetical protein